MTNPLRSEPLRYRIEQLATKYVGENFTAPTALDHGAILGAMLQAAVLTCDYLADEMTSDTGKILTTPSPFGHDDDEKRG